MLGLMAFDRDPLVDVQINKSLRLPGLAFLPEGQPGIQTVGRI